MLRVDEREQIRRAFFIEGKSVRQIARVLSCPPQRPAPFDPANQASHERSTGAAETYALKKPPLPCAFQGDVHIMNADS